MDNELFMRSGSLAVSLTTGRVYLEHGEDGPEPLGVITDDDDCPWPLHEDWGNLLDRWRDGRGHEREANRAFRLGIDTARMN